MPYSTEEKISVLITDDHTIVRQGLRTLLELMPDIEIAGEASNGKEALALVSQLKPAIVLMDLKMPEMDGMQATKLICGLGLSTKVIALTSFLEAESIIAAIQAGATSILLKDVSPTDLIDAIRATFHGEARLHPSVARKLMEQVAKQPDAPQPTIEHITDREMDVIKLVAQGMSNQEIAAELVLSDKTVKTHISSLLGKLSLNDRTQLAIYALKNGLVKEL